MTRPLRVGFVTIGCRANSADSAMLAEALGVAGYEVAPPDEEADVYVVNTCTVTHRAEADARAAVRRLARAHPHARIVATGCLAEVDPAGLAALPEVAAVVPNRAKSALPAVLAGRPLPADAGPGPVLLLPPTDIAALPAGRSRPYVKIQDGCDHACTYCIVPRARGASRSAAPDDVVATVRRYAELGAGEVVLTGIHVGLYGHDRTPPTDLARLLARLDDDAPPCRVRLSSLEPDELTDELLDVLRRPRFCPHLHLPLQSGDDETLGRMGRRSGTAAYAATLARARVALPDAAIGADVIVGFPGESEAAFERTLAFVRGLDLTYLHVFSYSPRPGTPAATFDGRVPADIARARVRRLRAVGDEKRTAFHERLVGRRAEALVEARRDPRTARLLGLTEHYVPVALDGPDDWMGRRVAVELLAAADRWMEARAWTE